MKTLYISLQKDYILDTAGNNIVVKYDLLNDILYELGAELAFKTKDDSIGDKTKILTDIRETRPETYEEIVEKIKTSIISKLLLPEVPEDGSIVFPDSYTDWMLYNSNQSYAAIGKKLKESGNKETLSLTDIYTDYIEEKLLPKIKNIINADKDIAQFTIVGVNDPQAAIVRAIKQDKESLRFEPYDGGWLQYEIGYAFGNGIGVQKNLEKAFAHYLAAAETRHAIAANWVGWCYQQGLGTAADLSKALLWYNIGAELGFHAAEANAAYFYENGMATPVDYKKATELYERALANNNNIPFALNNLATIYYGGKLGERDYNNAFKFYYREATTSGSIHYSIYMAGYMLYYGQGVEKDDREALKLLSKASDMGHKDAHFLAGKLYVGGAGTDFGSPDYEKAKIYFKRGIENGDFNSSLEYAKILIGEDKASNRQDIVENLRKASDNGLKEATYLLAKYIHDNKDFEHNLGDEYSAINLLSKLASENYDDSASLLKSYQQEIDDEIARKEKERREEEEREAERQRQIKEREEKLAAEQREKERLQKIEKERCCKQFEIFDSAGFTVNQLMERDDLKYNDAVKELIEPARIGLPAARAALGFLLLKKNPENKEALNMVLSSLNGNPNLNNFFNDVQSYSPTLSTLPEIRVNKGVESACYAFNAAIYFFGIGVEKDLYKAIDLAKISVGMATDNSHPYRTHNFRSSLGFLLLGLAYREGLGVPRDYNEARRIFERGLDKSPSGSLYYEYAVLLSMDDEPLWKIMDSIEKALWFGNTFACREKAKNLIDNEENAEAEEWLHKAIKNSGGSRKLIENCQSLLREIGGRVIDYAPDEPINVYFDEVGPTLEKPKGAEESVHTQPSDSKASSIDKTNSSVDANDLLKTTQDRLKQKLEEVKKATSEKVESKGGFFSKLFGKKN